jgi:hypothetical protein
MRHRVDWNTWASISAVFAALIAAIAFAWGAKTELDAARAQALATVLGIVQAQTQLALEYPDLAARDPDDTAALEDPRYVWFAINALTTADSIYALVGDDPSWRYAAEALVQQHLPFVLSPEFPCELFAPAFVRFVREETREMAEMAGVTVCPDG